VVSSPRRSTPARRRRPALRGPADAVLPAPSTQGAPAASPSVAAHPLLRALAAVAVVALALRIPIQQGLEVGHVLAVVLAPLWVPRLARHRGAIVVAPRPPAATTSSPAPRPRT
jgi:hypothetical protein